MMCNSAQAAPTHQGSGRRGFRRVATPALAQFDRQTGPDALRPSDGRAMMPACREPRVLRPIAARNRNVMLGPLD
jgi:hypothetical protein